MKKLFIALFLGAMIVCDLMSQSVFGGHLENVQLKYKIFNGITGAGARMLFSTITYATLRQ